MGRAEIVFCVSFVSVVVIKLLIASLSPTVYQTSSQLLAGFYTFFLLGFTQALQDCHDVFNYTFVNLYRLINVKVPDWAGSITLTGIMYVMSRIVFLLMLWFVLRAQYHVAQQCWTPVQDGMNRAAGRFKTLVPPQRGPADDTVDEPGDARRSSSLTYPKIFDVDDIAGQADEDSKPGFSVRHSVGSTIASAEAVDHGQAHDGSSTCPSYVDLETPRASITSEPGFWKQLHEESMAAEGSRASLVYF